MTRISSRATTSPQRPEEKEGDEEKDDDEEGDEEKACPPRAVNVSDTLSRL